MPTVQIGQDVRGEEYVALLAACSGISSTFQLMERAELGLSSGGRLVLQQLAPFLLATLEVSRWPGTQLNGHTATLRRYQVHGSSVAILRSAGTLFSWRQPGLPEDLAFCRQDGSCVLGCIAHEKDAFLELQEEELLQFRANHPMLVTLLG